MKNSFAGLDWLRFLLALYLVAFHTVIQYPAERGVEFFRIFDFGGFATSTFFILSGFVLTHVYLRESVTADGDVAINGGAHAFLVKRFANIYPIHIISLALILATAGLSVHSTREVMSVVFSPDMFTPHMMNAGECSVMLVLQVLLLQAWYPYYLAFNYPAWSLSTLAFFYLSFPFVSQWLLRCRNAAGMMLAMWLVCLALPVFAIVTGWHDALVEGMLHINPVVRLPEFMAGILAYRLFRSPSGRLAGFVAEWRAPILAGVLIVFVVGAWSYANGSENWKYLLHNGALMPVQALLIVACATSPFSHNAWLTRASQRLGNAALSIFVMHAVIFKVFNGVEKLVRTPYPLSWCMDHMRTCVAASHEVSIELKYFPVFLCVTVVASVVFQERVVGPVRRAIEKRLLGRRTRRAMAQQARIDAADSAQSSGV